MFSDLSVKSIVIPPASTGTTAISRAAVHGHESGRGASSSYRLRGHGLLWMRSACLVYVHWAMYGACMGYAWYMLSECWG